MRCASWTAGTIEVNRPVVMERPCLPCGGACFVPSPNKSEKAICLAAITRGSIKTCLELLVLFPPFISFVTVVRLCTQ